MEGWTHFLYQHPGRHHDRPQPCLVHRPSVGTLIIGLEYHSLAHPFRQSRGIIPRHGQGHVQPVQGGSDHDHHATGEMPLQFRLGEHSCFLNQLFPRYGGRTSVHQASLLPVSVSWINLCPDRAACLASSEISGHSWHNAESGFA